MSKRILSLALGAALATLVGTGAAAAADGWARSPATLRAGPSADYPAIMRVPGGEPMEIYGCLSRWNWCDVYVDGARGWFPGNRIWLERDGGRVVLPAAAALIGLSIFAFDRNDYWGRYYVDRPFRYDRRWYHRGDRPPPPPPGMGGPGRPPMPGTGGPGRPPSAGGPDRPMPPPSAGTPHRPPPPAVTRPPRPAVEARPPRPTAVAPRPVRPAGGPPSAAHRPPPPKCPPAGCR